MMQLDADQIQLLNDLVSAHLTNLHGDKEAIEEDPNLLLIRDEGIADIDAKIALADRTLLALT